MAELAFQRKEKERIRHPAPAPEAARAEPGRDAPRLGPQYLAFDAVAAAVERAAEPLPPAGTGEIALDAAEAAVRTPDAGAPLSPSLRAELERRFARDLSGVRVHTGPK